ncbi:MAG TPA: UDP-N-acetylmuramoyl-tripeptide--D-alanyl-D-alanine ligase [Verrucomicrobiae bacterium]|nr:UDP-N-acetylmuramoyl-tripeptide--D-alanyl-D-alanine ligase [Verrucomicrobiae bacterium]
MPVEALNLDFILKACAGELASGSVSQPIASVCTDSRQAHARDLFFAIAGDRFDGHQFLTEACAKGVAALVVQRRQAPAVNPGCAVIVVDDTRKALGRLAAQYRKQFDLPIVAIAGSNGKTTTKELIAAVLRQSRPVLWSEASYNNDIGVPLTLLRLEKKHRAAVLETGTNHPGELAPLVTMTAPQYGVITSIAREHLEFFHDLAGVAQEEGSLGQLLPPDGKLFLDGDSPWASALAQRTRAQIVRVGVGTENDWRAHGTRLEKQGSVFRVEGSRREYSGEYRISLLGKHQVLNALFAIALGVELGVSRAELEQGLAECKPLKMRLQLWEHNGVRILDDAYNANADSMLAALETLQALPCKGRRLAVLGDMEELGPDTETAHEEVGRRAAELGVGQLFAVGKMASVLARGARSAGLNRIMEFKDVESAAAAVKGFLKTGDLLLLKASRASRLERISELLKNM